MVCEIWNPNVLNKHNLFYASVKYFWEIQKIWKNKIIDKFNNITSAMFNTYLVSTLKFQFEKNDKFNNITSAMFNAYLISILKFENIEYFWEIQKIWKNKKNQKFNLKKIMNSII